jgi:hypothetical protein
MLSHSRLRVGALALSVRSWTGVVGVVAALCALPAAANLCNKDPQDVHRAEARELEAEAYSDNNDCSAGSESCWIGTRAYNARIIACNRDRDVKPFKLGPIQDVPLVHKAAGKHLDDRTAAERRFAAELAPRMISGQIQYFNKFPKWYGYILERQGGDWIVTTVLDFKFPNAERDKLHLPVYLAQRLSLTRGGPPLTSTTCASNSSGPSDNGMIREDWGNGAFDRACRLDRETALFLLDDDERTDVDYIDEGLGFTRSRPATEWVMHYWRATIETLWSRPDGSFQTRVLIANLAGRDGEMDEEDLDLFRKNDVVFEVELHHREGRANNMYRPIEIAGTKIYKAIYAGNWPTVNAHEFGHSFGLDDEYSGSKNPPPDRDCQALSGFAGGADQFAYAMCDDWDVDGDRIDPDEVRQHTVKSVYPWIVTQRYSIGAQIEHCKADADCLGGQYCKKPLLGVNRCVALKAMGDSCTADKQCPSPSVCSPKPFGKCVIVGSKRLGEACVNNKECSSGQCDKGRCVCSDDDHCAGTQFCDKGELTIGANACRAKRANEQSCTRAGQCQSGRCYLGNCKPQDECSDDGDCASSQYCDKGTLTMGVNQCVARKANGQGCTRAEQCQSGRCNLGFCAAEKECAQDGDCERGEYCDKGTAGIGKNQCKAAKPLGQACSRGGQCQSNCCKVFNLKLQCRPADKCD